MKIHLHVALAVAVILAGCASPPKPPVVDGNNRQPVNDAATQAVLRDRANRSPGRFETEAGRSRVETIQRQAEQTPDRHVNHVAFQHYFAYGSAVFRPSRADIAWLRTRLAQAERIEVSGRTDGRRPSPGDEKIARNRALAVRAWLVQQGVPPEKIFLNYLSGGDYAVDNSTFAGRTKNRCVEIRIFSGGSP